MPTGERRPARGFTYLALLFALAAAGAVAARTGSAWATAAQREREAELLFRGLQLREALQRYAAATPAGQPARPSTLEALLRDERRQPPQQHLRRLWADPFTGRPDWVLLRDADGGIAGLHSRDGRPALRRAALPEGVRVAGAAEPGPADRGAPAADAAEAADAAVRLSQWRFDGPAVPARRPIPRSTLP